MGRGGEKAARAGGASGAGGEQAPAACGSATAQRKSQGAQHRPSTGGALPSEQAGKQRDPLPLRAPRRWPHKHTAGARPSPTHVGQQARGAAPVAQGRPRVNQLSRRLRSVHKNFQGGHTLGAGGPASAVCVLARGGSEQVSGRGALRLKRPLPACLHQGASAHVHQAACPVGPFHMR